MKRLTPRTAGYDSVTQRRRQQSGRAGEDILGTLNAIELQRHRAYLRHRPTQILWSGGKPLLDANGRPVFKGGAGTDYQGVARLPHACSRCGHVDPIPRAVFLEAKRCEGDRFDLALIRPSQRAELSTVAPLGALGGVVIATTRWLYALPWSKVETHLRAGEATLRLADLVPWRVAYGDDYLAPLARFQDGER